MRSSSKARRLSTALWLGCLAAGAQDPAGGRDASSLPAIQDLSPKRVSASEFRVWVVGDERMLRARLHGIIDELVSLEQVGGDKVKVPFVNLSRPDQVYLSHLLHALDQAQQEPMKPQLIRPTKVYASGSSARLSPIGRLIDKSGLATPLDTGDEMPRRAPTHDRAAKNMWLSNQGKTAEQFVVLDLGASYRLKAALVWPYGLSRTRIHSVRAMNIHLSDQAEGQALQEFRAWPRVPGPGKDGSFEMPLPEAEPNLLVPEMLPLNSTQVARFVLLDFLDNHSRTDEFVGLSEVRFIGTPVGAAVAGPALDDPTVQQQRGEDLHRWLARELLAGRSLEALTLVDAERRALDTLGVKNAWPALHDLLKELTLADRKVLESFAPQVGTVVQIDLVKQAIKAHIVRIDPEAIVVKTARDGAVVSQSIQVNDLSPIERTQRLGEPKEPAVRIYFGLQLLKMRKASAARKSFLASATPLGTALAARIDEVESAYQERSTAKDLATLLQRARIPADLSETEQIAAVWAREFSPVEKSMLLRMIGAFRKVHAGQDAAHAHAALIDALDDKLNERMIPGLVGRYFANKEWKDEAVMTRVDPRVEFRWNNDEPHPDVPRDNFSVRWQGHLRPLESGSYVFRVEADDQASFELDGQVVLKHKGDKPDPISLQAGKAYPVTITFQEGGGAAHIKFLWKRGEDGAEEVVPDAVFFHQPGK